MTRVPVAATVREAYTFAATQFGAVMGLIWVPMLFVTVTGFFSMRRFYGDLIEVLGGGNPATLASSFLMILFYLVATLLLYAMIYVSVVQLVLGTRSGSAVAHFSFGPLEWRMFRALSGFFGLMIVLGIGLILLVQTIGGVLAARAHLSDTVVSDALSLLFYLMIVGFMPRFLLLLPAISVSENTPVLRRAWSLSVGNFWPLLGVLVAVFAPVFMVFVLANLLLAGAPAATSEVATLQLQMADALKRELETLPVVSGLWFLFSPFLVALFCATSVSVWRVLKDEAAVMA